MTARSIHIGLNAVDSDAYDGWTGELSGCINDATDFQRLADELGYETRLMKDNQATSISVLRQISEAARTLRAGDIVLITYSGHGSQVYDATSDEEDRLDETWCLWDREVIDDELYALYGQFEAGVRIVVISDSCHSGTVARFAMYEQMHSTVARGTEPIRDNGKIRTMPERFKHKIAIRDRRIYDTLQYVAGLNARSQVRASLILISGCQDNQLSYDGDANGLFTGTFLHVWNDGRFSGNYRDLHRAIRDQMPPYQTPNFFTLGERTSLFEAQSPFEIQSPAGLTGPGGTAAQGTETVQTVKAGAEYGRSWPQP